METQNFPMAPVGPFRTTSKITVWSSWAPPGFSCPYLINYMKITVFINIVTPNGLLNLRIVACFLHIPNYQKTNKTWIICFSFVFPLFWALGLHRCICFSIEMFKEIYRKRTCENIWNSENILENLLLQHLDVLKSM